MSLVINKGDSAPGAAGVGATYLTEVPSAKKQISGVIYRFEILATLAVKAACTLSGANAFSVITTPLYTNLEMGVK